MNLADPLLRWLPADSRSGVLRRAGLVWAMALLIALVKWLSDPAHTTLAASLVYSYAISTCIWFACDPLRIALRGWLGAEPPHYWRQSPRTWALLVLGTLVGYAAGTALGDAYSGHSTLALIQGSAARFWGFLLSSLGISLGFIFYFYQRERAIDLQRQATEAQLRLLESQLEPHMLFNTLANLRALIGTDPARATAMLDNLNHYLRATLSASRSGQGQHTLALEFERLRDYLALMAVRMGPRLRHTLILPEALAQHPLPALLLQPLVENAIRHGLEPSVAGGTVTIEAGISTDQPPTLLLWVRDTGVGAAQAPMALGALAKSTPSPAAYPVGSDAPSRRLEKRPTDPPATPAVTPAAGGFGLAQVHQRLQTTFGPAAQLQWQSRPGEGTQIELRLPLQASAQAQACNKA